MAQLQESHDNKRLDPRVWAKKLTKMQWQLVSDSTRQVAGFAPTTLKKPWELVRQGKLPTPLDWIEYSLDAS